MLLTLLIVSRFSGPRSFSRPYTLASANQLGLVLDSQEKYEEAEAMYRQGLEVREKLLGPENLDTLASV
jgi:hypothetical protein